MCPAALGPNIIKYGIRGFLAEIKHGITFKANPFLYIFSQMCNFENRGQNTFFLPECIILHQMAIKWTALVKKKTPLGIE